MFDEIFGIFAELVDCAVAPIKELKDGVKSVVESDKESEGGEE